MTRGIVNPSACAVQQTRGNSDCLRPRLPRSGADVQHCHRAAVLRMTEIFIADRGWPFLAVRNRMHAIDVDAARGEIIAHRMARHAPSARLYSRVPRTS